MTCRLVVGFSMEIAFLYVVKNGGEGRLVDSVPTFKTCLVDVRDGPIPSKVVAYKLVGCTIFPIVDDALNFY